MGVYIKGMEMPKRGMVVNIYADGRVTNHFDEFGKTIGQAIPVPEYCRLIDVDKLDINQVYNLSRDKNRKGGTIIYGRQD